MIDARNVPDVSSEETVARYILFGGHIRKSDQTVKHDAFMPPANRELSVTRHRSASLAEIWAVGFDVAHERKLSLHGRADVAVAACLDQKLQVQPDPILPQNPNHAVMVNWPADKPSQMMIAKEVAKAAAYSPRPAATEQLSEVSQPQTVAAEIQNSGTKWKAGVRGIWMRVIRWWMSR